MGSMRGGGKLPPFLGKILDLTLNSVIPDCLSKLKFIPGVIEADVHGIKCIKQISKCDICPDLTQNYHTFHHSTINS